MKTSRERKPIVCGRSGACLIGLVIAHCQFPISDWRLPIKAFGNRQLAIENTVTAPVDGLILSFYARAVSHG